MNTLTALDSKPDRAVNVSLPRDVAAQQTLKTSIGCAGIGLHSGAQINMTLYPAPANTGILFRRVDLDPAGEIPARYDSVIDTRLCTVIGIPDSPVRVATIEHLMSALAAACIDNCYIELDGPEVPAMDGSAAPFLFLIDCAGVCAQTAPRLSVEVLRPVSVTAGDAQASLVPAPDFSLDFELIYDHKVIGRQMRRAFLDDFAASLARARTFGLLEEVEAMRNAGFARGGSLENAVVVSCDGVMNEDGLRFDDEFVRHKILDAVGDLYTAGAQIIGHFSGLKSGHAVNNLLLKELFCDTANFRLAPMRLSKRGSVAPEALLAHG